MTRLFNRKKDTTTIAELEEYYANQNQKKTRTGMAWFWALLSLLITVAVIVALFFGGQWLFGLLNDDDSTPQPTSSGTETTTDLPSYDGDIVGQENTNRDDTTSGAQDSSANTSDEATTGVVTDEAATTSESNADRIATTGDSEIPNTGAGEILIIAPIAAGVFGYTISRRRQLQRK